MAGRSVNGMPDRENVIKGVHDARRYLEDREWVDKSVGVHIDALNDALALLKEQEAVEPKKAPFPDASRSDGSWYFICGACSKPIDPVDKYCRECEKPILWECRRE